MADSIDALIAQSQGTYQPQFDAINKQVATLPGLFDAQQQGLDQTKTNAFDDITNNANSRGLLYSGIPIGEQQKYVGATYLPAVAQLKQQQNDQTFKLQSALNDVRKSQYDQAISVQQHQLDVEEQQREKQQELAQQMQIAQMQAAASRAAAAAKGPSAATVKTNTQQSFNNDLLSALNYAKSNPGKVQNGYREQVAQALAANYGYDIKTVNAAVGQVFPNGWEWKYQIRK